MAMTHSQDEECQYDHTSMKLQRSAWLRHGRDSGFKTEPTTSWGMGPRISQRDQTKASVEGPDVAATEDLFLNLDPSQTST